MDKGSLVRLHGLEAEALLIDNSPATQPEYDAKVFKAPVSLDVAAEQAV